MFVCFSRDPFQGELRDNFFFLIIFFQIYKNDDGLKNGLKNIFSKSTCI